MLLQYGSGEPQISLVSKITCNRRFFRSAKAVQLSFLVPPLEPSIEQYFCSLQIGLTDE